MQKNNSGHVIHPGRAMIKLAFLAAFALMILIGCLQWVDQTVIDTLKYNLDASAIILLVIAINLMSFVLFCVLYIAWQWVRQDLKPPRPEQIYSDPDKP
jgi:heme/copper-type cytochrome/quinol oxidase subunit 2